MSLFYRNYLSKGLNLYSNYIKNIKTSTKNFIKYKTTAVTHETIVNEATQSTKVPNKLIGWWLAGCSGMVVGAVVLGGVTRLTESGLSMVDWQLIKDMVPPKNQQEWIEEFEKYKQFPEWKYLNKDRNMTLNEFKFIFYMEWGHRMWGRLTGMVFLVPALIFWRKGYFNKQMKYRILALSSLLGFQGFLGWYMVKSGLNEPKRPTDVPRVSQYRLAAHLSSAFLLYSGFLWNSLSYLLAPQTAINIDTKSILKASKRSHALMGLIFATAVMGAFVAGLDAGLVYNSFPKMADRWIPSDILAYEPKWTNIFENPTTVQFEHRLLGMSTLAAITAFAYSLRRTNLSPRARMAVRALVGMACLQVTLGISTLLLYVPTELAALHQSGSLALLSIAIWLTHELKRLPKV